MRGREEDAPTFTERGLVVLHAFAADPLADVVPADRREAGKCDEEARDRAENAIDDRGGVGIGKRHREILSGDPAQAGDGEVEQAGVPSGQSLGDRPRGVLQGLESYRCQSVLDPIPKS
jgi:hypothetical protein